MVVVIAVASADEQLVSALVPRILIEPGLDDDGHGICVAIMDYIGDADDLREIRHINRGYQRIGDHLAVGIGKGCIGFRDRGGSSKNDSRFLALDNIQISGLTVTGEGSRLDFRFCIRVSGQIVLIFRTTIVKRFVVYVF